MSFVLYFVPIPAIRLYASQPSFSQQPCLGLPIVSQSKTLLNSLYYCRVSLLSGAKLLLQNIFFVQTQCFASLRINILFSLQRHRCISLWRHRCISLQRREASRLYGIRNLQMQCNTSLRIFLTKIWINLYKFVKNNHW